MTGHITMDQAMARYPRLVKCMQWVAILSSYEAGCCIRDFKDGYDFSGEAVNHFGGPRAVITRAIASRHVVQNLARLNAAGGN